MSLFETRNLAIYASIVGTLDLLWTFGTKLTRDRPRVAVRAYEGVDMYGGPERTFMIRASNRGRGIKVDAVSRQASTLRGTRLWMRELAEAVRQGPDRLEDGDGHTYMLGPHGYKQGLLPTRRWFLTDGAGRIYPLRERYRQRVEGFVLWPVRRFLSWSDGRSAEKDD